MTDLKLQKVIQRKIDSLPLLPQVAFRLMNLINDENHSIKDVVKIIETDAPLTGRVLRVANSAAFSRGVPISTVNRAILHLGENMVVGIALGSFSSNLMISPLKGYLSVTGELWDHSLRTAITARKLTEYGIGEVNGELAYTAGLLHDIGKLVLSEFLEGITEKLLQLFKEEEYEDYIDAENDWIGTNHADVGSTLAQHWRLPDPLCSVIKNHHRPNNADEYQDLSYMVHLGDIFAMMAGDGTGADSLVYKMDDDYVKYVNIDESNFTILLLNVQEEFTIIKEAIQNP